MIHRPLLAAALLAAAPASAGLEQEPRITESLITVGIAYEISEVCPSIDARRIRGLRYLFSIKQAASDLGYSDAEIDAFIDDDAAKDRLEAIARRRLEGKGARPGDVASHCQVGAAEIAANSPIGQLLSN